MRLTFESGNPRLRTTMVQLAWLWLRHQPDSALALWFHDRVKRNGGRLRKTTIVALARKLLVALWKCNRRRPKPLASPSVLLLDRQDEPFAHRHLASSEAVLANSTVRAPTNGSVGQ